MHDIAAADELAIDIDLRNGWPVGVALDAVSHQGIGEHVFVAKARRRIEYLDRVRRKAALRKIGVPFMYNMTLLFLLSLRFC